MRISVSILSHTLTIVLQEDKSKTIINTLPLRKNLNIYIVAYIAKKLKLHIKVAFRSLD